MSVWNSTGQLPPFRLAATHTESFEEQIPECFVCPISHLPMTSPVCTPSGHTYELSAILEWLKSRKEQGFDPKSPDVRLSPELLVPNRGLKEALEHFTRNYIADIHPAKCKKEAQEFLDTILHTSIPMPDDGALIRKKKTKSNNRQMDKCVGCSLVILKVSLTSLFASTGFVGAMISDCYTWLRVKNRRLTLSLFTDAIGLTSATPFEQLGAVHQAAVWSIRLSVGIPLVAASCFFCLGTMRATWRCARHCVQETKLSLHRREHQMEPHSLTNWFADLSCGVVPIASLILLYQGYHLRGRPLSK